jgi:hypothetical protein
MPSRPGAEKLPVSYPDGLCQGHLPGECSTTLEAPGFALFRAERWFGMSRLLCRTFGRCWRGMAVVDAVSRAAFLMPLVHALFVDTPDTQSGKTTPETAPMPRPTQKRRNELLPEEI